MKKLLMAFAIFATALVAPIRPVYAGAGECTVRLDAHSSVKYKWDCCNHKNVAAATVIYDGTEKEKYEIDIKYVKCYVDCCIM